MNVLLQILRLLAAIALAFIYADMDSRLHRIVHIYHEADEKELDHIQRTDKKREQYYNFYSGQKFGEASNYDICLNSSVIGIDKSVEVLKDLYASKLPQ